MTSASIPQPAPPHRLPVPFVVGTGRCGTTLLRLMLDAHPDLAIPPETHFIPAVARACRNAPAPTETFLKTILSHRTWPDFHLDETLLRNRVNALNPFNLSDALRLFFQCYAERFNKPRWGEKTPVYSSHMRLIQQLLPEAHFIHLVRDGRDVALSVKEVFFGPKNTEEAGRWWAHGIREAHYQARQLSHYLELRYEDLVQAPEDQLRKVCQFLDLPWNEAMLEYHKTSSERLNELEKIKDGANASQRKGIHQWTTKPPQASRLARWKKEMTQPDRQAFESQAGDVLQEMGYLLSTQCLPQNPQPVWMEQVDNAISELHQLIPPNQQFLLIDQAEMGDLELQGNRRCIPFPNRDGQYSGRPEDDAGALSELERLRNAGASHLVIAWPAFWWLDHYRDFSAHIRARFPVAIDNSRLLAFNLQTPGGDA